MADDFWETPPEWAQGPDFDLEPPPETPTDQEYKDQARKDYLDWIESNPDYQDILDQTRQDYTPKSWISSPVKLPRFSTEAFKAMKEKYQAKYGNKIVIPKFEDTIQWNAPPSITAEEYAAHKYAQKHGIASPLDADQLAYLAYKKTAISNNATITRLSLRTRRGSSNHNARCSTTSPRLPRGHSKISHKSGPKPPKGTRGPGWMGTTRSGHFKRRRHLQPSRHIKQQKEEST